MAIYYYVLRESKSSGKFNLVLALHISYLSCSRALTSAEEKPGLEGGIMWEG